MAADSNAPASEPLFVGNAFVEKYYNLLYKAPEEVHKFYLEESVLGRPGQDGEMTSVKSLKAINDEIMSFDFKSSKIQILTADSQGSYKNGVIVLVTGLLAGQDGGKKKFSQSFFLTPQKGSYFVLNDVFRYVNEEQVTLAANAVDENPQAGPLPSEPEPTNEIVEPADAPMQPLPNQTTETSVVKADTAKEKENVKVSETNVATENDDHRAPQATFEPPQDAPKKSFASIVQSLAGNAAPFHVKASLAKPRHVEQPRAVAPPKAPAPVAESSTAKSTEPTAEGGSIFIANLPMDATPEQLTETFKQFGAIRADGVQVRSYKLRGNCFGFVAFESANSVKNVLQAAQESPIRIGDRKVSIEEKRANNDGSKSSGRNGGYRNENGFRPRGNNFNGSRGVGYGRNGYDRRGGDANQKAYPSGRGRAAGSQPVQAGN